MRFSTERMALLAIDLQTGFCHPGGSSARRGRDITPMKNAAEKSLALVQHARIAGLPVIWTTITFHPQYRDGGPGNAFHVLHDAPPVRVSLCPTHHSNHA